jgi:hypothetical protein
MGRVREQIRSNALGLIAIFIALSGTAYAIDGPLAGQNTVGSADVINNDLVSPDLKNNSILSTDVRDWQTAGGGLTNDDLATDAVDNRALKFDSVVGGHVIDDTLSGSDVNESTLDGFAFAKSATRLAFPTGNPAQEILAISNLSQVMADCTAGTIPVFHYYNKSAGNQDVMVDADGFQGGTTGVAPHAGVSTGNQGGAISARFQAAGGGTTVTIELSGWADGGQCRFHGQAIWSD